MDIDTSPFTPNLPVSAEYFVGRQKELERLAGLAKRAIGRESLTMGYVSGERGIGKSTLVKIVRDIMESEHGMIGAHVNLSNTKTVEDAVAAIYEGIVKDNFNRRWWHKIKETFAGNDIQVGFLGGGVNFTFPTDKRGQAWRTFADDLRELVKKMGEECKGLFLVLDDINGLATNPDFANWLKSLNDSEAVNRRKLPAAFVFAGLEERRQEMISSNESVNRIFLELINLEPWNVEETCSFFARSFDGGGVSINQQNIEILAKACAGFPMLAHEVGHAVWLIAKNQQIKKHEIEQGIIMAADTVGNKWLKSKIDALKRKHDLSILLAICGSSEPSFTRKDAISKLSEEEGKDFDLFIRRIKDLGVLVSVPNKTGQYQFPNKLYEFYFWQQAKIRKGKND